MYMCIGITMHVCMYIFIYSQLIFFLTLSSYMTIINIQDRDMHITKEVSLCFSTMSFLVLTPSLQH